jgi:purine-binding chemotaxis protein CheW
MNYLIFTVYGELFGIAVLQVQEISTPVPIYPIPGHDRRIKGLMNLRGNTVAVVDMRKTLFPHKEEVPVPLRPKLITLESDTTIPTEARQLGMTCPREVLALYVDGVCRIIPTENNKLYPVPAHLHEGYVDGVIKTEHGLVTMLSLESLTAELYHNAEVEK